MILAQLKVTLTGPLWKLDTVEIENIDVEDKWEDDPAGNGGSVTQKDVSVSDDDTLDVFIALGAPNGTQYTVALSGKTDATPPLPVNYSEDFTVVKNGRLKIIISKTIPELTA